jgi:hypothetical protein
MSGKAASAKDPDNVVDLASEYATHRDIERIANRILDWLEISP